ncbi:MAG: YdiU family protein [Sideroxydans sp.]|nr:YdiU family protein [Sideroxydans sp.]
MHSLQQLTFLHRYAQLGSDFSSEVYPTPLPAPYLVSFNAAAARLLDLDSEAADRPDFAEHFCGNRIPPNARPLAMLYAGHQFGHFVSQLGDGRAILLGEICNAAGQFWEVQLKGAGATPYSRRGDGRAVLRSSIREYLCSEAMHGLGIPTSRALCIVGSDATVYRESAETAAVLTRLAPSHVRFGSFEVFFYRGQFEQVQTLADFVIENHYAEFANATDKYRLLLREITRSTAHLMAHWQAVGFCHGVMNTDNMSILGLTLDYGPFGFMENFNAGYICNHSDPQARYAYDQQPQIGLWNLSALAHALSKLIDETQRDEILEGYAAIYYEKYAALMGAKLGLKNPSISDLALITSWLQLLQNSQLDYTNTWRSLSNFSIASNAENHWLRNQFIDRAAFDEWAANYRARLHAEHSNDSERKVRMDAVNPKYILRNYLAQIAIERAEQQRDFSEVNRLLALLSKPFDEQPDMQNYAAPPPESARQIVVSCSS